MELRHLQALVAVAESGSFSAAADTLGTVQSNISAHVARLERELGLNLVDRGEGRLTPEGEVVVARAYRVLGELNALTGDLGALRAEVSGTVRAGMIGTTARWLVPLVLADLAVRHPKIRLVVADGTTTGLEPQVSNGRLDFAIVSLPVPGRDLSSAPLFAEDLVLVVPVADDPLRGERRVMLEDLARFELLLPAPGTPFRAEIDAATNPAGVVLRPRAELDGVRLLASLTFEGYGPAVLPATAVPMHLRDRFRLVFVDGLPRRQVGLAIRSRGLPSASARAVLEVLLQLVATPDRLPDGLHPVSATSPSRAEGSLRVMGVPNG
ncbi:MAG TPA: LysR family transcriptional regulator [Acidimicrobiales bacterium]|nr:LysR family transcriptional regulator [Acidimicrobiales bacterium]